MQPMKLGAKGADVVKLQEKLKALGFNPGLAPSQLGLLLQLPQLFDFWIKTQNAPPVYY